MARLFHGPAHDSPPPSHPEWCDGGPRGLLDLETPRRLATDRLDALGEDAYIPRVGFPS